MKTVALLATAALLAGAVQAQTLGTWANYRNVTINTTNSDGGANVSGTVTNYPVLVRLSNAHDSLGANVLSGALAGGADLRFTNAAGTEILPHEIDYWSATDAAIWVRVPSVAGNGTTTIRMYWNRAGTPSASDGSEVFRSSDGFIGVWHMGGPDGPRPNAVGPGNPATPVNAAGTFEGRSRPGIIGLSDSLAGGGSGGAGEHFDLGPGFNDFSQGLTYTSWTYFTTFTGSWWRWFDIGNGPGQDEIWLGRNGNTATLTFENATSGTGDRTSLTNVITTGNQNRWMHVGLTVGPFSGGSAPVNIYIDGGAQTQSGTSSSAFPVVERTLNYLARSNWGSDAFFRGFMDEQRMFNVQKSADWIKLDYETQRLEATAVRLGATQTQTVKAMFYGDQQPTYLVNVAISPNNPVVSGSASGFSVTSGTLPAGLNLNSSTGVISGTPTTVAAQTQVVIGATVNSNQVLDTLRITITAGDPPNAPTNVVAISGNAEATVSWSAPVITGTTPITSYVVRAVEDTSKTCTWSTGDLNCTVTGLTNGTAYTFTVRAVNSVGPSPASAPSAAVTPATRPSAPTNVQVSQLSGSGQTATARVSWTAPASDGGQSITGSFVFGTPSGACFAPAGDTTCTVGNLAYETEYTFRVAASNSVGMGDTSQASNALTPVGILPGTFAIQKTGLSQPFTFTLSEQAMASTEAFTLSISDVWGRTIWSRTVHPSRDNVRELTWNGRNTSGRDVSAGMYLVRVHMVSGGVATNFVQKASSLR